MEDLLNEKFTYKGESYYLMHDFALIIGKEQNTVYQMIYRNLIPKKYLMKKNKILFVNVKAVEEQVVKSLKTRKLKTTLTQLKNLPESKLDEILAIINKK